MEAGRMAVVAHPGAGAFGLWQAGMHTGAQLVNEPGALTWNELQSRDVEGAKALLSALFGHGFEDTEMDGMSYSMFSVDGTNVGGMMPTPDGVPAAAPSFWLAYFGVENADEAFARAQELGGSVVMEPMSVSGVGRFGVLADPQGATFAVIQEEASD
jgi:predicted enzyme related to lactoylglutathione lyase